MRSVLGLGGVILISTLYLYCLASYLPPVPRLTKQNRVEGEGDPGGEREIIGSVSTQTYTLSFHSNNLNKSDIYSFKGNNVD